MEVNTERVRSSGDNDIFEDFSIRLSHTLDCIGYGRQQRQFRKDAYRQLDAKQTEIGAGYQFITVGSKNEGITNVYESDRDVLIIDPMSIAVDEGYQGDVHASVNVFSMNTKNSHPGHAVLFMSRPAFGINHLLGNSILQVSPTEYVLSGEEFIKNVEAHVHAITVTSNGTRVHGRVGPATLITNGALLEEQVYCIRCYCPTYVRRWISRPRHFNWPPAELMSEIANMEAYVVPKGSQIGQYKHLEWRICFNTGETLLINSLNDIQTKLYVVLKMILKEIIMPLDKEITSFSMKNIVFWLAEMHPDYMFRPDTLYRWIIKALRMLKRSIRIGVLPYYMIPDRNLLLVKMTQYQKRRLLLRISCITGTGPWILMECTRLRKCMLSVSLERLECLGNQRNELEMLYLMAHSIGGRTHNQRSIAVSMFPSEKESPDQGMWRRIYAILFPEGQHAFMDVKLFNDVVSYYITTILC